MAQTVEELDVVSTWISQLGSEDLDDLTIVNDTDLFDQTGVENVSYEYESKHSPEVQAKVDAEPMSFRAVFNMTKQGLKRVTQHKFDMGKAKVGTVVDTGKSNVRKGVETSKLAMMTGATMATDFAIESAVQIEHKKDAIKNSFGETKEDVERRVKGAKSRMGEYFNGLKGRFKESPLFKAIKTDAIGVNLESKKRNEPLFNHSFAEEYSNQDVRETVNMGMADHLSSMVDTEEDLKPKLNHLDLSGYDVSGKGATRNQRLAIPLADIVERETKSGVMYMAPVHVAQDEKSEGFTDKTALTTNLPNGKSVPMIPVPQEVMEKIREVNAVHDTSDYLTFKSNLKLDSNHNPKIDMNAIKATKEPFNSKTHLDHAMEKRNRTVERNVEKQRETENHGIDL